jgi:hypothetical protein
MEQAKAYYSGELDQDTEDQNTENDTLLEDSIGVTLSKAEKREIMEDADKIAIFQNTRFDVRKFLKLLYPGHLAATQNR